MTGRADRDAPDESPAHPIRTAVSDDEPFLRQLQGLLPEPNPELLSYGLSAGTVLVTTAVRPIAQSRASSANATRASSANATRASSANTTPASSTALSSPATGTPVGYLLSIDGAETHLAELVVAPDARREGRASALLAALLARRPDGERVTLSVAAGNEAAQSLYRSFGFERIGSSDTLYEDGRALLFERIM